MFEKLVVIDGRGHLLGRLASTVAKEILLGYVDWYLSFVLSSSLFVIIIFPTNH